ncbi:MAG TPA: hypothetical protein PLU22_11545, partial [Polyangiaceae bacterium]|nr:hypothetical protein [Polyangiaceae bacterium]
ARRRAGAGGRVPARRPHPPGDRGHRGPRGGWGAPPPEDLLEGLTPEEPPRDDDQDGMADDWERARGLDPDNPADHNRLLDSGYTAIEEYLDELAAALLPE